MKEEALNLVESLNNESFVDGGCLDYYAPCEFISIGFDCQIKFMGVHIWSCDNDEREWTSDEEKESLRSLVVRESKKIISDLVTRTISLTV